MIVTIHQPDFLPWLGFFDRWKKSDLYIVLDDVQFLRRGWHHRDQIKTAQGPVWLTVPVKKKGKYTQTIRETEIDNDHSWREKHLKTIQSAYRKAPNFGEIFERLRTIYQKEHMWLMDLNMDLLEFAASELDVQTSTQMASAFQIKTHSTQRLVDLVKCVEGDVYLTGLGSKDYLDETIFEQEGIAVQYQQYEHPLYPQLHGEFVPKLSVLDYLMMR